jgi:hypothetical protein
VVVGGAMIRKITIVAMIVAAVWLALLTLLLKPHRDRAAPSLA